MQASDVMTSYQMKLTLSVTILSNRLSTFPQLR